MTALSMMAPRVEVFSRFKVRKGQRWTPETARHASRTWTQREGRIAVVSSSDGEEM